MKWRLHELSLRADNFYRIDSRELVNFSLTYEREDWDIQAFCTNCADEAYIAAIEGGTGNRMIYGNPRSAGVRFRKDF
jgi:hypothetical protein